MAPIKGTAQTMFDVWKRQKGRTPVDIRATDGSGDCVMLYQRQDGTPELRMRVGTQVVSYDLDEKDIEALKEFVN